MFVSTQSAAVVKLVPSPTPLPGALACYQRIRLLSLTISLPLGGLIEEPEPGTDIGKRLGAACRDQSDRLPCRDPVHLVSGADSVLLRNGLRHRNLKLTCDF